MTEPFPKLTLLMSYAYLRGLDDERIVMLTSNPNTEVLLDCGAFTAKNAGDEISLDDYCTFLEKHGHRFCGALALDVVGDPVGTEKNLKTMLARGLRPIPVHVLGDDEYRMDELFGLSDWVACAGLRRPHRGAAPTEYLQAKMQWAKGRRVHWLGYVRDPEMAALRPYSADCASWTVSQTYGWVSIYEGRGHWLGGGSISLHDALAVRHVHLMPQTQRFLDAFGIDRDAFADARRWRSSTKMGIKNLSMEDIGAVVPLASWVWYSCEFQARFGTRVFIALSSPQARLAFECYAAYRNAVDRGLLPNPIRSDAPLAGGA